MFKILLSNCCGLDVHKTWILACIGITDNNNNCSVSVGCKCTLCCTVQGASSLVS